MLLFYAKGYIIDEPCTTYPNYNINISKIVIKNTNDEIIEQVIINECNETLLYLIDNEYISTNAVFCQLSNWLDYNIKIGKKYTMLEKYKLSNNNLSYSYIDENMNMIINCVENVKITDIKNKINILISNVVDYIVSFKIS